MTGPLVAAFPEVGPLMSQAYYDLYRAETAKSADDLGDLDPIEKLPRPWDIATVANPDLRFEVWGWLDAVVVWLNTECVWDVGDLVPQCWPSHPHLVHELGVLADQRRRAGLAFTSDALDEWQRYTLPSFLDRMRARYRGFCEDGHQPAPGRARIIRYNAPVETDQRGGLFAQDLAAASRATRRPPTSSRPLPQVVDGALIDTRMGEIIDAPDC